MAHEGRIRKTGFDVRGLAITLLASFAAAILLLLLFAEDFPSALRLFFLSPFGNRYAFGNMLAASVPLMIAGLGVSVAFASRNFNLGGEGQVYAGGLAAVLVCLALPEAPPLFVQVLAASAAAACGALIGALSGILKRYLDVDELISSFLGSAIVVLVVDYFITGPFQDGSSNFQTTLAIAPAVRFVRILPPSSLSTGLFLGLFISLVAKFVFDRTRFGYELRVYGQGGDFARYAGIDTGFYTLLPMGISGALHGLAGAAMIMGSYYKAMKGFSGGVGWSAISVALIAHNDPLLVIPAALFLAWLEAGAKGVMIGSNVTSEIVSVVQAVIFFLITARFARRTLRGKPKGASR
jgi:simple sugar transport system permease protein